MMFEILQESMDVGQNEILQSLWYPRTTPTISGLSILEIKNMSFNKHDLQVPSYSCAGCRYSYLMFQGYGDVRASGLEVESLVLPISQAPNIRERQKYQYFEALFVSLHY